MEPDIKLSQHDGELLSHPTSYRSLIGKLIYLTITRPNISYAINRLSQFLQEPRLPHFKAAQRILQYLKGNPAQGLLFHSSSQPQLTAFVESNFPSRDTQLKIFSDADWGTCPDTRRFI